MHGRLAPLRHFHLPGVISTDPRLIVHSDKYSLTLDKRSPKTSVIQKLIAKDAVHHINILPITTLCRQRSLPRSVSSQINRSDNNVGTTSNAKLLLAGLDIGFSMTITICSCPTRNWNAIQLRSSMTRSRPSTMLTVPMGNFDQAVTWTVSPRTARSFVAGTATHLCNTARQSHQSTRETTKDKRKDGNRK